MIFSTWFLLFSFLILGSAQEDASTCSSSRPCYQGCCSAQGNCGFGPKFCGDGCQGTCTAVAECGQYAPADARECPINVCCSQYGYCGVTDAFCGTGCQKHQDGSGCGQPPSPSCPINTDATSYKRRIGYYELFNLDRACDKVYPESLAVAPLSHINIAFGAFDSNFNMIDTAGDIVSRVTFLKKRHPGLRVNIAVGGWAFNDPPNQFLFSDMVSTETNRQTFITSLVSYMTKYSLDGVDIDWEYPAADDRGGRVADTQNYVLLMAEIQDAFQQSGNSGWDATITLPTSYWYLRGFDINRLQKYVSWFNLMSYDLHGMWDQHNRFTGPYLNGHTNISEIDQGLKLLWRNGVDPKNVVLGFAFYGRSFTMADPSCYQPNGVCKFSTAGQPGDCTQTAGILTYSETTSRNTSLNVQTYYDAQSTVKYTTYELNQWISYDDEQSFFDKKAFLSSRCLSGLMIWAIDQDTQDHAAISALFGEDIGSQLEGGSLDAQTAGVLSSVFGAYTGQNCFVTPTCTDGTSGQMSADQVCPSGFSSVSTAHAPIQAAGHDLHGQCDQGWYRSICCPTKEMPQNCRWNGAPVRSESGCSGLCSSNQFLLNTDTATDAKGLGQCYTGTRNLCCDSTQVLNQCSWTACQGPTLNATCPPGSNWQTYRYDDDNGGLCSASYISPIPGNPPGSPIHQRFQRAFCCPTGQGYSNCNWSNDPPGGANNIITAQTVCAPQQCSNKQTEITQALNPPISPEVTDESFGASAGPNGFNCAGLGAPAGYNAEFPYCCDPPHTYSDKWPVDPKFLFANYYDQVNADVMWSYADNFGNNGFETVQPDPSDESGHDAYGFVMLDGEPGSLDNEFPNTQTVARQTAKIPKVKRSLLTTDSNVIDSTFDHEEEVIYVYCNFPQDSPQCQRIWYKGAEDTIIRLPTHIGSGPYARVVSMVRAEPEYELPSHHITSRSLDRNSNPVYKLTFDYDFHLIKRADPINMRVDYTNLLGYWDELTNIASDGTKKRSVQEEHLSMEEWRSKVKAAKGKHDKLRERQVRDSRAFQTKEMKNAHETNLAKRWFGTFLGWLSRLTTVESKNKGTLAMVIEKSILLYKAAVGCPGSAFSAKMQMFLDTNIGMNSQYAYYFAGTIIPPAVTDTYFYFSLEPSAYLGIRILGNARLQYSSGRQKLIDTLSYPGLSIKGIASVGPTLDVFGEIRGVITLKGQIQAGATVNFGQAEVYWPQDDVSSNKYQTLIGIDAKPHHPQTGIEPSFDASVEAHAQLDIIVTPTANIGIQIGGKLTGGSPLVNAQIQGILETTLDFQASGKASGGTSSASKFSYSYGAYLLYNLGYNAKAQIKGFGNWALGPRYAYSNDQKFVIYENTGTFTASPGSSKRGLLDPPPYMPRKGLLNSLDDREISSVTERPPVRDVIPYANSQPFNNSASIATDFLLGRRAGISGSNSDVGSGPSLSGSQQLTCPPGNGPEVTLPDFRLSGTFFGPGVVSNNANPPQQVASVFGIANGITTFLQGRALANSQMVLTWDPIRADSPNGGRRAQACGTSYCLASNTNLKAVSGVRNIETSCDEFPFAGTEEGGNWLSTQPNLQQRTNPQLTCVPAFQQTIQGSCNKMLSTLQTNVAYYDNPGAAPVWKRWSSSSSDNTWTPGSNNLAGSFQRIAEYPQAVPQAFGIDSNLYLAKDQAIGYMFKRNFTVGIAQPTGPTDGGSWAPSGAGAAQGWAPKSSNQGLGTSGTDLTQIACAMNHFDQTDVYQYGDGYNGYCYRGTSYQRPGFGTVQSLTRCLITFAPTNIGGSQSTPKRSIGSYGGHEIQSVELIEDAEQIDIDIPVAYLPEADWFPVAKW